VLPKLNCSMEIQGDECCPKNENAPTLEAYFSTKISVPYYKIMSREIVESFRSILTPFVFKSIVAFTHPGTFA
jgi:hypothetical protein